MMLTLVGSINSQSNKFVTGVWIKAICDSKLNDSPTATSQDLTHDQSIHISMLLGLGMT